VAFKKSELAQGLHRKFFQVEQAAEGEGYGMGGGGGEGIQLIDRIQ
jgi:hypothetical protein